MKLNNFYKQSNLLKNFTNSPPKKMMGNEIQEQYTPGLTNNQSRHFLPLPPNPKF